MSTKGYLTSPRIKAIVFGVQCGGLALLIVSGLLSIWNIAFDTFVNQLFATAGILSLGSLGFLLVNYLFGNFEKELFTPSNSERIPDDPDFASRLEKAKSMRTGDSRDTKVG